MIYEIMMLKVPVLIISALVLILVVATVFKQHQRKILWSAAIVLFVGTLLLVGFGVIDPVGETRPNLPALTGIIMALGRCCGTGIYRREITFPK